MRYEIGDMIRIKDDLITNTGYGTERCYFVEEMEEYLGCQACIIDIDEVENRVYYLLDIDDRNFHWVKEMFEEESANLEMATENELMGFLS